MPAKTHTNVIGTVNVGAEPVLSEVEGCPHLPSRAKLGKDLFEADKQYSEKSKPLSQLISPEIYTTAIFTTRNVGRFKHPEIPQEIARSKELQRIHPEAQCTNSGHPLVERLHSLAYKRDKSAHF